MKAKPTTPRPHVGEFYAEFRDGDGRWHRPTSWGFFPYQEDAEMFANGRTDFWRVTRIGKCSRGDTVVSVGRLIERGPAPIAPSVLASYAALATA